MSGNGLPSLGRVNLADLLPSEGVPSDSYKQSVSTLSQSLAEYSAAIIQLRPSDGALLRSCLDSARLYFHQKPSYPTVDMIHTNDSREWCKTSGYSADPQLWLETYDYRPGLTPMEPKNAMEFPPAGLPDIFMLLGKAARDILDAIGFYLNLRSSPFNEILDNVPLRSREISSSVLSVSCHARSSFEAAQHHNLTTQEDGQLVMFPDHDHQLDKSLISVVKSDKAGLHIRDLHGRWIIVDESLGPQEAIIYPGLALYQATAGYISPALYRTDIGNLQGNMYGRCSLAFKLMPKSMTSLSCSEMRSASHVVEAQFQLPIPVDDFMQRPHHIDQISIRNSYTNFSFPTIQDGSMKPCMKRKNGASARCKPLPPSKRLRLEAQRVLKDRVQDIADKKGIRLRFCNLKECENHIHEINSPCANIRMEIGWPPGVPFVHPHDLPNKAKIGFLEAFEPGWSATHDMELSLVEPGQASQHSANCHCNFSQSCACILKLLLLSFLSLESATVLYYYKSYFKFTRYLIGIERCRCQFTKKIQQRTKKTKDKVLEQLGIWKKMQICVCKGCSYVISLKGYLTTCPLQTHSLASLFPVSASLKFVLKSCCSLLFISS